MKKGQWRVSKRMVGGIESGACVYSAKTDKTFCRCSTYDEARKIADNLNESEVRNHAYVA